MKYILLIPIFLMACTHTKKVQKDDSFAESHKSINTDSLVRAKIDSVKTHYESQLEELNQVIEFGENCNDSVLAEIINNLQDALFDSTKTNETLRDAILKLQSLPKEPAKIIYKSTGEFEAIGLKKANLQLLKQLQIKDSALKAAELEKRNQSTIDTTSKTSESSSRTFSKTGLLMWWWLFVLGYILCVFLSPKKIISLLKTIKL